MSNEAAKQKQQTSNKVNAKNIWLYGHKHVLVLIYLRQMPIRWSCSQIVHIKISNKIIGKVWPIPT